MEILLIRELGTFEIMFFSDWKYDVIINTTFTYVESLQ